MPKAIKENLFDKIISIDNLYKAFYEVRKTKKYDHITLNFESNLAENIHKLRDSILNNTYRPCKLSSFTVYEPKLREIEAPAFIDRVLHCAIDSVLSPLLEKKFIYPNYASIKDKGTLRAAKRVMYYIRKCNSNNNSYCLRLDISQYFKSINHSILYSILKKYIKDKKLLSLLRILIFNIYDKKKGIPIGSLVSQLFANLYLNELDKYIYYKLNYTKYARYMDDIIVFTSTKEEAKKLLKLIQEFLYFRLKLKLNPKSCISKLNKSVYFSGYICRCYGILPRKRNICKFNKRIKTLNRLLANNKISLVYMYQVACSFYGYVKHCLNKVILLDKIKSLEVYKYSSRLQELITGEVDIDGLLNNFKEGYAKYNNMLAKI